MRLRQIKKYGNSYFIALKPMDMVDLKLSEGQEIDIDDININLAKQEENNEGGKSALGKKD